MEHPARRLFASVALATLGASACGGDSSSESKAEPAPTREFDPLPEPKDAATSGAAGGTTVVDPFGDDGDWGSEAADEAETEGDAQATGADATGGAAAPVLHPGPCSVSWSGAARLRFAWDDDGAGGTVRIDGDRDGKSDVCAKFRSADGRTTEVSVDEGCNKSFEGKIVPTYAADTNLATATYTETTDGTKSTRELTLVALPSFTGVAPGYPLWAAKADVKLKTSKGLVKSATVKAPHEGPPLKVDFAYDKDGRIQRVKEDFDADGSVDRQFDYKFDDAGNVTRVTLKMGRKGEEKKSTASVSYTCWSEDTK